MTPLMPIGYIFKMDKKKYIVTGHVRGIEEISSLDTIRHSLNSIDKYEKELNAIRNATRKTRKRGSTKSDS